MTDSTCFYISSNALVITAHSALPSGQRTNGAQEALRGARDVLGEARESLRGAREALRGAREALGGFQNDPNFVPVLPCALGSGRKTEGCGVDNLGRLLQSQGGPLNSE